MELAMIDTAGLFAGVVSIGLTVLLAIVSLLSLSIAIITSEKPNESIWAQPAFAHVIGTVPGILIGLGIFIFVVAMLETLDRRRRSVLNHWDAVKVRTNVPLARIPAGCIL
jgi:hypothetical protein